MPKLSDTQFLILSAACRREDLSILPLPANLKGGAAQKVVASLLAKGLIAEAHAGVDQQVWCDSEDGQRFTLVATDAAIETLGIVPDPAETGVAEAPSEEPASEARSGPAAEPGPTGRKTRAGTKQADLVAMLRQPEGASLDEIVAATGWQAHTVRGAIAGALKKKLGLTVTSEKVEGRGRVYRICAAPEQPRLDAEQG